jgi:hypothetical protein
MIPSENDMFLNQQKDQLEQNEDLLLLDNTNDVSNVVVEKMNDIDKEKNIYFCEELHQYEDQYIYFCDAIKNNIINEGNFIRILYSKPFVLLNGIYLRFTLNIISVEKYYNKLKCNFNKNEHMTIIEKCKEIEEGILKKMNLNKMAQYKVFEQFKNGNIKIFNECLSNDSNLFKGNCSFVLKISGIWENDMYYGLTFKFLCRGTYVTMPAQTSLREEGWTAPTTPSLVGGRTSLCQPLKVAGLPLQPPL